MLQILLLKSDDIGHPLYEWVKYIWNIIRDLCISLTFRLQKTLNKCPLASDKTKKVDGLCEFGWEYFIYIFNQTPVERIYFQIEFFI